MLTTKKSTPFEAMGAQWELIDFEEIPHNVFIRMIQPGGSIEAYDGVLRPVRFKPNHGKLFPCFYARVIGQRATKTISIPMKEWREHVNGDPGSGEARETG